MNPLLNLVATASPVGSTMIGSLESNAARYVVGGVESVVAGVIEGAVEAGAPELVLGLIIVASYEAYKHYHTTAAPSSTAPQST